MTTLESIQSAAAQIVGGTLSESQQGLLSLLCGAAARELELRLRPGDEIIVAARDLYDGKVVS